MSGRTKKPGREPGFCWRRSSPLQPERLNVLAQLRAKIVALQCKIDRSRQHAQLVARIIAPAFKGISVDLLRMQQALDAVGQLQLAARTQRGLFQQIEDLRRQNETADDCIL